MRPQLHLVTDPTLSPLDQVERIERAVPHGVDAVHVRLPHASAREVYDLAVVLQAALLEREIPLIVNDRVDVALAVNAKGVQLGARGIPVRAVRQMLGPVPPIGASVHTVDDAVAAEVEGATWVTFGHVYETASHPDEPPRGLDALRAGVDAVRVPVIAIGGIDAVRIPEVLAAGAGGVAVISSILQAEDTAEATTTIRSALDDVQPRS